MHEIDQTDMFDIKLSVSDKFTKFKPEFMPNQKFGFEIKAWDSSQNFMLC